jgi:hypothetical protein
MSRVPIAFATTLLVLGGTHIAEAQRWGRPSAPRAGACFYQDANFQGDYFCTGPGQDIAQVPDGMNDRISSIRTFGDTEVTIYQDARFRGRSEQFGGNIRNLRDEGWNDRLSSIRIRSGYQGPRDRFQSRGNDNRPGGGRFNGDPDRIVRRAYQDILNREPDTAGLRLYRSRMIDDGWTEDQVREALRRSPEYRERNTMTRARAQDIVRRAYQSVLGREPDPASETYVIHLMRDKWSEQDVIRELRRSDEFRNRNR